jgi:hypothetical protein
MPQPRRTWRDDAPGGLLTFLIEIGIVAFLGLSFLAAAAIILWVID